MFKRVVSLLSGIAAIALLVTATGSAAAPTVSSVSKAYYKSANSYNVVVRASPGSKLGLYVNDKSKTVATVNNKDWATFKNVHLPAAGKLSFTKFYTDKAGKQHEQPVRFVRYFTNVKHTVAISPLAPSTTASAPVATPTPAAPTPAPAPAPAPTPVPAPKAAVPAPTPVAQPQPSCTNGSYVNSAGNTVCSPEAATSAPAGATAQCRDGTYSFSQSRSGTCSHHGGVATWL